MGGYGSLLLLAYVRVFTFSDILLKFVWLMRGMKLPRWLLFLYFSFFLHSADSLYFYFASFSASWAAQGFAEPKSGAAGGMVQSYLAARRSYRGL